MQAYVVNTVAKATVEDVVAISVSARRLLLYFEFFENWLGGCFGGGCHFLRPERPFNDLW